MLKASTSPRVAHTALDFVFFQEYERGREMQVGLAVASDPKVFKQKSANSDRVIYDQFGGGGLFAERTNEEAELKQSNPRVANNVSLEVQEFDDAVDVPRNFMMDEKHDVIKQNLVDMAYRAKETQDDNALNKYALGFTTVLTNDGNSYYNNSHTAIDGTSVDNLETGVLTASNFETLIISLGRQKNQGGILGHFHASLLLVPYNLIKEATEIVDSELLAGTGNNNINYLSKKYPGLEVKCSAVLDDTSTTAYFLSSDRHSMTRWVREDVHTNYISWDISKNWVGVYQAGFREVVNPISYEAGAASDGSI